jgi:hypothetical protein
MTSILITLAFWLSTASTFQNQFTSQPDHGVETMVKSDGKWNDPKGG